MWEFDQSLGDRRKNLANPPSFEEITKSILQKMNILCRHEETCGRDSHFFRAGA